MNAINRQLAEELGVQERQIISTVGLLDEGSTVPFIARYRKEITGGLDDGQLRKLEERLGYLRELEDRRNTVLSSIEEQQKLTPELKQQILSADTKTRLEDLYLPYKIKRRTKAQIAREAGLAPLADALKADPMLEPEQQAASYIDAEKGVADTKAALDGARQILMEQFAEDAALLEKMRSWLWDNAYLKSAVATGKELEGAKFSDYFDYLEALNKIPSHRALAFFRGRNESVLNISLQPTEELPEDPRAFGPCEAMIAKHVEISDQKRPADRWLLDSVRWCWRIKLQLSMETELLGRIREMAEQEAIKVFADNMKDLLMAAPAGQRAAIGLDPGLRTGVKIAVLDNTGKLVDHTAIFPHAPRNNWNESLVTLAKLAEKHNIELMAIGNGTASRETDKLVGDLIKMAPQLKLTKVMVSEAGASVYSASEIAAAEFPNLDVTIRGAVSIARRLQDPLAELVKIEPKSIGVGQYQHDVSQSKLAKSLSSVVEDCVNAVGVDMNMASAALLTKVAGLNKTLAQNLVDYRDSNGSFKNRKQLLKVSRLGPKAFEQCAGFIKITNGDNPLDASAVHPESYPVVEKILKDTGKDISLLIGDISFLNKLDPKRYIDEQFGLPTVTDIIKELEKPGRDPRPEFKTATFMEGVEKLSDLQVGMVLEGTVTNVTNFGAFVDVGVHQDGLVHISAMSEKFISDPREVVKAGDLVKVKVMEVDIQRKRVGLTMRMTDKPEPKTETSTSRSASPRRQSQRAAQPRQEAFANNAFADAFAKAKKE
ncbi:Tex family protein [Pelagibaculum spongiae]|uniref:RNA-binding transcriptional accessory protein n=1 Tax=Pelagibaculum spongiae TaxID=2080658 RepID=A0A2V1GTJ3_9GAMM|nr:Tex family protein [Pelagibaculum spongiae]PVZ68334.1 RNA-binding transcriptional accessory protein [Pelagibaculum spongiae]